MLFFRWQVFKYDEHQKPVNRIPQWDFRARSIQCCWIGSNKKKPRHAKRISFNCCLFALHKQIPCKVFFSQLLTRRNLLSSRLCWWKMWMTRRKIEKEVTVYLFHCHGYSWLSTWYSFFREHPVNVVNSRYQFTVLRLSRCASIEFHCSLRAPQTRCPVWHPAPDLDIPFTVAGAPISLPLALGNVVSAPIPRVVHPHRRIL